MNPLPLETIHLPCGASAHFDGDFSYRCEDCFAVVGSIGQPDQCKDAAQMYKNLKTLGGKGWDYERGTQEA